MLVKFNDRQYRVFRVTPDSKPTVRVYIPPVRVGKVWKMGYWRTLTNGPGKAAVLAAARSA